MNQLQIVPVSVPDHVINYIDSLAVKRSEFFRTLAFEHIRKSNLSKIQVDAHVLKVTEIDTDSNNVTIEISEELRKLLKSKTKKIVVKL